MKSLFYLLISVVVFYSCRNDDMGGDIEIRVPVSVEVIKRSSIEEFVTTTATVNATKNTLLKSEIEGKYHLSINPLTKREFVPGDLVPSGQVIVYFDSPEYENGIGIESKKLNLDISKREFEKQQSLYKKGGVTLRELKNSEKSFIDAQYAYENAILQLQKMKISAPFKGTIIDLPYFTKGTNVNAGTEIIQLMDFDKLYADLFFPSNELTRIKVNQKLRVTHYSSDRDTLLGRITQVSPALNPETRSFKATIMVDNPNHIIRPGMFVKIETIIASKDSVIVIPKSIILSKRRGKTVYVVEKGAANSRTITTGLENSEQIEVIRGLKVGESLVTKGFETLGRRSKVKIVQ